ncbi:PREDICTED: N-terminal Xaa-Pro-Lys N-methyltransferase 1-B [Ceratosolen solmsi marchali]|uniref:Alpha N-terminal protein methyltransferase 1 n=1 Tax=Ceratosolen solmsi marchali TaxID=326594 RepID=A0AAJ6YY20_9HYME|nr:PREDICTED: N-terminal Xaa-Pro-Lys N-methyltransferase 1-B [Ceratosolen solmsi marchali]
MEQQVCESQFILQQKEFYEDAAKYWEKIPATVDGMLGGFGFISQTDIIGSKQFLKSLFQFPGLLPGRNYALDCGAGIGRITGNLLTKYFKTVDLVEQNPKFLEQAKLYLKNSLHRVGQFYSIGLQDFCPEPGKYDVIWCQWVLGHLNNNDLIKFFQNCKQALKSTGLLVVKENVTSSNVVEVDKEDSSITRPHSDLLTIFEKSGFKCIKEERQYHMPDGLYPVYMFAIKPCDN